MPMTTFAEMMMPHTPLRIQPSVIRSSVAPKDVFYQTVTLAGISKIT